MNVDLDYGLHGARVQSVLLAYPVAYPVASEGGVLDLPWIREVSWHHKRRCLGGKVRLWEVLSR